MLGKSHLKFPVKVSLGTPDFVISAQSRRRVTYLQSNVCKRLPETGNQTR